ncbi:MAG: glycosyltransferase [Bacteroidia bacterium]|nr:glycosyltransferase [Bacteroidia bacterium]
MISVCLATYNGEKYIKQQIDSILAQLSVNDELIVSDDSSYDNTVKIITDISDSRIKIFTNNEKGYTSNFENTLRQARGNIIFLSDQDDIWLDNKVEICIKHLKTVDLVVSDCQIINCNNEIISESFYELRKPNKSSLGNLIKFGFLGCCLAFRSDILKKALPFPTNRKLCTHDNWLFLVGACLFTHKVLNDKLILYRRHSSNISPGSLSANTTLLSKIRYRLYLCLNIMKRYIRK